MPSVARVGDLTSHGGVISTGSLKVLTDGFPTAKIGSIVTCPLHGLNAIITGSLKVNIEEIGIAFVGSLTACGAIIITGSSKVNAS